MADLEPVLGDLVAESESLDALVQDLSDTQWRQPTPAEGWTIAHQIGHLAWTDDIATTAAAEPEAFAAELGRVAQAWDGYVDRAAAERAEHPAAELLDGWRRGRARLVDALRAVPPGTRIPWFGPPMSPTSMATARLMETWAHGQDVADTLGVARTAGPALRHVAHIGVRTRDFAYAVRDLTPPGQPFRVELVAPDGTLWTWGPDDAPQQVAGPALDFCLLVTQRRHRDDLALVAVGDDAESWLDIAQAFAGPPGEGRAPGQFPTRPDAAGAGPS